MFFSNKAKNKKVTLLLIAAAHCCFYSTSNLLIKIVSAGQWNSKPMFPKQSIHFLSGLETGHTSCSKRRQAALLFYPWIDFKTCFMILCWERKKRLKHIALNNLALILLKLRNQIGRGSQRSNCNNSKTFLNNAVSPTNENTCPETYTLQMNVVFQPRAFKNSKGCSLMLSIRMSKVCLQQCAI